MPEASHHLFIIVATAREALLPACSNAPEAEQEVWWMLEAITGQRKAQLCISVPQLTESQSSQLQSWIKQRVEEHKPLAYILGNVPFGGLE